MSVDIHLKEDVSEEDLLKEIDSLNGREDIDGILVQLPLPKHINEVFFTFSMFLRFSRSCHGRGVY